MSILGNIFGKIFPSRSKTNEQASANQTAQNTGAPAGNASAAQPSPAPTSTAPTSTAGASPAPTQAAAIEEVDVERILNDMTAKNPQKLNWRTSIVDLMKLLDLDSSLAARKELAKELNYTGDTSDSASMNIWLHKQVMNKLAENGGKVPADLKD
ncbi:DUF3597 domain-containing protein [Oxalobacteraceae bacterium R-40]|uniref:DUF3597 domain-containing protein n=1 Tax=Keguizhuia sedimenti TaxID=3064264 RepID=A0ABU1BJD6_9BURK|nr:DUF3597 domain-containing protein [Oxalobacteraceae bacterium R-40]